MGLVMKQEEFVLGVSASDHCASAVNDDFLFFMIMIIHGNGILLISTLVLLVKRRKRVIQIDDVKPPDGIFYIISSNHYLKH